MIGAATSRVNTSFPVHANVLGLSVSVVVSHYQAIILCLVTIGASLATPLHVWDHGSLVLAHSTAGVVIVVLVHRTRVFILYPIQQRAIVVFGAVARGPLRRGVHAQVVDTAATVRVIITSNETLIQLCRSARATA